MSAKIEKLYARALGKATPLVRHGIPYLAEASMPAQKKCPHYKAYRSRSGDTCAICGSIKVGNRWWYLRKDWFMYYGEGGVMPPKVEG